MGFEQLFTENGWPGAWRNGIFSFHHYHSTSHEVLGIYAGKALVHLGGENGEKVNIEAGDIIISWGDETIDSPSKLKQLVAETSALERVQIEVLRQGSKQKHEVAVGSRPLQF